MAAVAAPAPSVRAWSHNLRVRLSPRRQVARAALLIAFALSTSLVLELVVVSNLQHRAAQQRSFDQLRAQLAAGTAPVGPTDHEGRALAIGAPVAFLEIPAIGLRQVVGEGTTPSALFDGPGHRRDTPLPGQAGTSMILGRRAAFGGAFRRLPELERGDLVRVTTAQGEFDYRVLGLRREGERAPGRIQAGEGRLILVTADGRPYMPSGVLRVDAELEDDTVPGPARLVSTPDLPGPEQIMGADTRTLWALALWLQLLLGAAIAAVWSWHRWGRAQTWVVFLPVLLLVGTSAAGEAARLMPNLL